MSCREEPILILSSVGEPCTDRITEKLKVRNVPYVRLNYEEVALEATATLALEARGTVASLSLEGCKSFRSVWFRRWGYPIFPSTFTELARSFAFNEFTSFFHGLGYLGTGELWVNHPGLERQAANKMRQLVLARKLGFRIPRTLITNDPRQSEAIRNLAPRVVFKPLSGTAIPMRLKNNAAERILSQRYSPASLDFGIESDGYDVFTQRLEPSHLEALDSIRFSPVIFQEEIEKAYEIRVTVVGEEMFAAKIFSQERIETVVDFRNMTKTGMLRHEPTVVPSDLQNSIRSLMQSLGLVFACLDFAVDKMTGDWVFFEVNPSGQWLWIEDVTNLAISDALADLLVSGNVDGNA